MGGWMYQWVEHKKDENRESGTKTVYTYTKSWRSYHVDSSGFHKRGHDNPSCPLTFHQSELANAIMLGDFKLPLRVVGQMQKWAPCELSDQWLWEMGQKLGRENWKLMTHSEEGGL